MKRICQILGAILMTFGLEPAAGSHDPTGTCPSIGAVETQFSSTCDSCVVTDGTKTIDQDETTYGTLQIVGAGSGTMRATAQGGVVFPAGNQVGIQHSISFNGDVAMLLRTYEKEVLQEEFAIEDYHSPISFKTTRPYDAVEFAVSQFDPGASGELPIQCGYAPPTNCTPDPHEVEARIHEFCTGPDTTPDPFTFTDQTDVEPGTIVTSAPVTITGIDAPTPISVSYGWYSIGCTETYTAAPGSISNGQTVCLRHWASVEFGGNENTWLTVGGVSAWFTSTTRAEAPTADVTPEAFAFSDQSGVEPGATVTSNAVTIAGIEAPASISVDGGAYSIGCSGTFTSAAGSITSGQAVCVRHTAAGTHGTATDTTLTVGGISDTFTSTTAAAPAAPAQGGGGGGGALPAPLLGMLGLLAALRVRKVRPAYS